MIIEWLVLFGAGAVAACPCLESVGEEQAASGPQPFLSKHLIDPLPHHGACAEVVGLEFRSGSMVQTPAIRHFL